MILIEENSITLNMNSWERGKGKAKKRKSRKENNTDRKPPSLVTMWQNEAARNF
jgi:hypothetical protein